ncbi:hypothetical protein GYMLUDRAFT_73029 [Collybiopsis luxurians FD-317 M1]|uniref:HIG1 domain-containing protein n=1 Tax=Collybiopsis luxurians FD-317 M1 TaxID=944289 RepID=A0A0D0CZP2_9AGAR|nr:hypothetical protein GYMLUDRAFT_73029 [Collybiopsis luxurians FD-317 M1]
MSSSETPPAPTAKEPPLHIPIDPNSRRWTESYKDKLIRKTTENPFVPIGTLITTTALIMSAIRLRQGNSQKFQIWLRYRVAFQALTIFAILGGIYKYGQANLEENQRVLEKINMQRAEKERERERGELERRIQEAGREQEEERGRLVVKGRVGGASVPESPSSSPSPSGGVMSMVSWPKWGKGVEKPVSETSPAPPPTSPQSPPSPPSTSGSSWWNPFSWGKSS